MATMPMKEDSGQEIYTRDHGIVKVDKTSWMDGGFHIVLCPNGAYQHINGLPIKDESEIHKAFGRDDKGKCPNEEAKQKCLNWFRNRHDQEGKAPRPIGMHPDGYPIFDDGTVPDFDDLYAYFRPGKGLTGMIVALQDYKDRTGAAGPTKELRKAAPVAADPAPAPAPEKPGPRAAAANKRKSHKTKSKTASTKPAPQQVATG